mmetsp:Transcript_25688/g.59370  ORF Transcript_25688/g.59370 Transcript_25688/m.59370 type:complete len:686 (-) Transcript_25688:162-2219(-)
MAATVEAVGEWTNAQLKAKLAEFGVAFLSRDKKEVLIERYLRHVQETAQGVQESTSVLAADVPSTDVKVEVASSRGEACASEEKLSPRENVQQSPGSDSLACTASGTSPAHSSPAHKDKEKKVKKKDKDKDKEKKNKKDRHEKRTSEVVRQGDRGEKHRNDVRAGKMEVSWLSDEDMPAAPAAPCLGQEAPQTPFAENAESSPSKSGSRQATAEKQPLTPPVASATAEVTLPIADQSPAEHDACGTPPVEPTSALLGEEDCEGSPAKKAKRTLVPPSQDSTCASTPSELVDPGTRSKDESTTQDDEPAAASEMSNSAQEGVAQQDERWGGNDWRSSWKEDWSKHRSKWCWRNDEAADRGSWNSEQWSSWDQSNTRSEDKWREASWEGSKKESGIGWRESWENSSREGDTKFKDGHNLNNSSWEGSSSWSSSAKQDASWPSQQEESKDGEDQDKQTHDQKSSYEGSWPSESSSWSDANSWTGDGKNRLQGKGWNAAQQAAQQMMCAAMLRPTFPRPLKGGKGVPFFQRPFNAAMARPFGAGALYNAPVDSPLARAHRLQLALPPALPQQGDVLGCFGADFCHAAPGTAAATTASVASTSPAQVKPLHEQVERADPVKVFEEHGFPQHIHQWQQWQDIIFKGWPALPEGWVRCFSKSKMAVYYTRMADMHSTFEEAEIHNAPPLRSA